MKPIHTFISLLQLTIAASGDVSSNTFYGEKSFWDFLSLESGNIRAFEKAQRTTLLEAVHATIIFSQYKLSL